MSLAEEAATSRDLVAQTARSTPSLTTMWPILVILLGLGLTVGWIVALGWIAVRLLFG
jgi:hypothetical protein